MRNVKKDIKSELDVKEMIALNLAKTEWSSAVSIEPAYGTIEYELENEIYTVKLGTDIDYNSPGIMDFDDDFLDPFRDRNRIRPPTMEKSISMHATGSFDVDLEKEEVIKQVIKIKEKESWRKRDPWSRY